MIDREYKKTYEAVFREIMERLPQESYYESALLSYAHRNPLMSWLFWKRVDTALRMAGTVRNKSVLDFGCGAGATFACLNAQQAVITGCDSAFSGLAAEVVDRLGIRATIFNDLGEITGRTFDVIFALDVLEHVDNIGPLLDLLLSLAHEKTRIIVSGPTENAFYRVGRLLSGFSGHSHVRNIYHIEEKLKEKHLKRVGTRTLIFPVPLFRVSVWTKEHPAGGAAL